jgi:hypothetical protein
MSGAMVLAPQPVCHTAVFHEAPGKGREVKKMMKMKICSNHLNIEEQLESISRASDCIIITEPTDQPLDV